MQAPSQAFRAYLRRRDDAIEPEMLQEEQEVSKLFNEKTFYRAFVQDMLKAEKEVIICSPFVTKFRSEFFKPIIKKLKNRNIEIFIFTRPIEEYDLLQRAQATSAINDYKELGVNIFCPQGNIHEKIAIIDREILWEGSLNILSQRESREMMRRITDDDAAQQVMSYLELNNKLAEAYKIKYDKLCRNLINNSRQNFKLKLRMFLLGLAIPVTIWWIFYIIKSMMILLRSLKLFAA